MAQSSARARRLVLKHETAQLRIASLGIRAAERLGRRARIAAIEAVMDRENVRGVGRAIMNALAPMTRMLATGMVTAHLRGRRAMFEVAGDKIKRSRRLPFSRLAGGRGGFALDLTTDLLDPAGGAGGTAGGGGEPYDSAVSFLQRRLGLDDFAMASLQQTYGQQAAFVMNGIDNQINRRLLTITERLGREGVHVKEGVARLRTELDRLGLTIVRDVNGRQLNRGHLLETVFRTQTNMAYQAGRIQSAKDPAIDDILWGWEYVTVGDDRVRPAHVLMDGVRMPKDDPRWSQWTPPAGWNCRCSVNEIWSDDGDLATLQAPPATGEVDGQPVEVVPDDGWDFNPAEVFATMLPAPPSFPV